MLSQLGFFVGPSGCHIFRCVSISHTSPSESVRSLVELSDFYSFGVSGGGGGGVKKFGRYLEEKIAKLFSQNVTV